jgi:hypothetical protein
LVLSLQQFGRLAADTHVRQTNRVLSLVEDAFYALSDRWEVGGRAHTRNSL